MGARLLSLACWRDRCSDLAADAVGLLDALGVSAAHVVSFSTLGGATAQKMVIEHTARVSSLTMISGGTAEFGMPPPDPEAQKALEAVGESAAEADPVATFVAAARVLMSESNFDEERVTAVAKLANERAPPADGTAQGHHLGGRPAADAVGLAHDVRVAVARVVDPETLRKGARDRK